MRNNYIMCWHSLDAAESGSNRLLQQYIAVFQSVNGYKGHWMVISINNHCRIQI